MALVKIVDRGLYFYFLFLLYFLFSFLFFFYFQNNSGQGLLVTLSHQSQVMAQSHDQSRDTEEGSRWFQNKVILYSMDNTCWPHVILMVIQGRMHSSKHRPLVVVYKVDYFVKRSLSSSLVLLNTRVVLLLNPLSFSS